MLKGKKKSTVWMVGAALIWFLICMLVTPVYTNVQLTFQEDPSGEVITTVYAGPGNGVSQRDAKNRVVNSGMANISYLDVQYGHHSPVKRIDPVDRLYEGETPLAVERLVVRQNGFVLADLSGDVLADYFTGNDQVQLAEQDGVLGLTVTGEDPQLLPTEAFVELTTGFHPGVRLAGFVWSTAFVAGIAFLVLWLKKEIQETKSRFVRVSCYLFFAGLVGAVFLCIHVGLRSPFWLNPDEYDTKAAVLYYFRHFMPPDIRSSEIHDSYPVYGTSRHFEFNLFYFYTGRIGRFLKDAAAQIRWLNLTLFAVMAGITFKNIKKNYALLFVLLLTPQVWYIFSYSTSDALDFFVGFLCLYQLMEKNSLLNRTLRERFEKRHIWRYGILGVLFVHVMWSKLSFYPILLFLFLILLIRLLYQEKEQKAAMLKKCLALVGLTLLIFGVRYMITDYPYYGFDKLGTIIEVTEDRADYGYKPSTPPLEQADSMSFFGKGITLKEFYQNYDFHKNLFRTFAGFFGTYTFGAADWYYNVMGALYLILLALILYELYKMKNRQKWWEAGAVGLTCLVQYLFIVINAYFIDFQPQGRYLLPALFYIAYLISICDRVREHKGFRMVLCVTTVLSLYAFYAIGVYHLIPANGV